MKDANDLLFNNALYVTNEALASNRDKVKYEIRRRLVDALSVFIADAKAKEIKHDSSDTTEYRLSLYIATPDEFWEIVRAEAEKMIMFSRDY